MGTDRRWLMLGLGVSLLLNVFLVGVIGGHVFGGHVFGFGTRPSKGGGGGSVVPADHIRALPKDERKLFDATMAARREAIRVGRQEQQRLRAAAEADIAAPTFDRDKVTADFKAIRDNATAMQQTLHEGLLEALQSLSPASRAALVAHEVDPH